MFNQSQMSINSQAYQTLDSILDVTEDQFTKPDLTEQMDQEDPVPTCSAANLFLNDNSVEKDDESGNMNMRQEVSDSEDESETSGQGIVYIDETHLSSRENSLNSSNILDQNVDFIDETVGDIEAEEVLFEEDKIQIQNSICKKRKSVDCVQLSSNDGSNSSIIDLEQSSLNLENEKSKKFKIDLEIIEDESEHSIKESIKIQNDSSSTLPSLTGNHDDSHHEQQVSIHDDHEYLDEREILMMLEKTQNAQDNNNQESDGLGMLYPKF